jgi:hypothetical protein
MTYDVSNFGLNIRPIVKKTVHIRPVCPIGGRIDTDYSLGFGGDELMCGSLMTDGISLAQERRNRRKI